MGHYVHTLGAREKDECTESSPNARERYFLRISLQQMTYRCATANGGEYPSG